MSEMQHDIEHSMLEKAAGEIDEFVLQMVEKYQLHPLSMSSVIVGRLVYLTRTVGCSEMFMKLINSINEETDKESNPFLH